MTSIGGLSIQIVADVARFSNDMNAIRGKMDSTGAALSKAGNMVKGAFGGMLAGLSVAGMGAWIKSAIDAADETSKLAKSTGIATKDVAGLRLAFALGGAGADAMGINMARLSRQIGEGAAVFDTLGIKTKNADGSLRSTKDVLYDTADAFKAMGSGTLATSKAVEIFGRSGAVMVPMLLDGSAGLKLMAQNAEKLGLVIDTETGAAAEEFNDTLEMLGMASKGVANQLMAQLLPTLNSLAGSLFTTVTESNLVAKAAAGIGVAFKVLYSGVAAVIGGFSAFGTYLGAVAAAAVMVANGEFRQAAATMRAGFTDAGAIVKTTAKSITDAWTGTGDTTVKQAVAINKAVNGATATTKDYETAVKNAARAAKDAGAAAAKQAADDLKIVTDLAKGRSDARQAEEKAIADWDASENTRRNSEVKASRGALAAAQLEFDTHGMLRSQIAEVTLQRLADKQAAFTVGSANYESVQLEINAQRDLVALLQKGEVRDASAEAAKASAAEWAKVTDGIGQGLTDSLFRAFESGKDFFSTFWSGIKNLFKTTVLKMMIQPVQGAMNGVVGSVMGGLTGTASAGQAGGGAGGAGGMLSSLSNMSGMLGTLGTIGTTIGTSVGAGLMGTLGGAGAATFGAGATMASGAIGAGSAVGAAGGLGMMAGAAIPYVAAVLALYAAYKALRHKPTPHMGSVVGVGADGTASSLYGDPSQIMNNFSAETDTGLRALGGASVGSLNRLSKSFGGAGGFGAEFKFATDGKDPSIGSALFSRNGAALAGGVGSTSQFAFFAADREAAFKAFTADVARSTREALNSVGLPKWARDQFAKLGDASTIEEFAALADAVAAVQTAMRSMQIAVAPLGGVFARVAGLSGDALKQLADFAGGIQAFGEKVSGYVANYYSEAEQAAISAASLTRQFATAGVDGAALTDRGSFRAMMDATDVGTEAGRLQLAALLDAQAAFAPLADFLKANGGSLSSLAAMAPSIAALGDLGMADTAVATVDGLATLDGSVQGIGNQITAAVDALRASVEAGLAATAAAAQATTRQLERWDDGDGMVTVPRP